MYFFSLFLENSWSSAIQSFSPDCRDSLIPSRSHSALEPFNFLPARRKRRRKKIEASSYEERFPSASTLVSFRPEQRKEGKISPGKREATFLPRDSCSRWGVRDKLARTDSNTFPLSFSAHQSARIYVDRVRVCVWRERGAQTDYVCGWVWKGEKILASRLCGGLIYPAAGLEWRIRLISYLTRACIPEPTSINHLQRPDCLNYRNVKAVLMKNILLSWEDVCHVIRMIPRPWSPPECLHDNWCMSTIKRILDPRLSCPHTSKNIAGMQ